MAENETNLAERLALVRQKLETASAGRYPAPKLIAVTKTHPLEAILPLAELGVTAVGENRVQELMTKLPALEERFQVHLIGRLQTNKVKYIIEHVCMIQSLDRLELAREIDRQAERAQRRMDVLVQVSPAGEPQKGGLPPEELRSFLEEARRMPGLRIRGLMAVMPLTEDQAYLSGLFRDMRTLFDHLREDAPEGVAMEELSMGMSGDYELAAAAGATMVRVGSALFGPRSYPQPVGTEEKP